MALPGAALAPAAGVWLDSFFLSADGVIDPSDVLIGQFANTAGSLVPGASATQSVMATVPGTLPGTYQVLARTDVLNQIPESDENNNWFSRSVIVGNATGITGQWQGTIIQGATFMLNFSLAEAGDGSVTGTGTLDAFPTMTIVGSRTGSDVTLTMTVPGFTPFCCMIGAAIVSFRSFQSALRLSPRTGLPRKISPEGGAA